VSRGHFWTVGMRMVEGQQLPAARFQIKHGLTLLRGIHLVGSRAVQAVFDGVNGRYPPRFRIPRQQTTPLQRITRLQAGSMILIEQRPFNR
jgi:hypothetical protein